MNFYDAYPPYVPVRERRAKAERKLKQLQKKNANLKPITIEGRQIATTWWGKSWNNNLERYADYSYRLERGRSYVRHRAVLDLQLSPGTINALVLGSSPRPYDVTVTVKKLSTSNWRAIRKACEGCFDSLHELLAGQFPQSLKNLFYEEGSGLFPSPKDIRFQCSCEDWASMCKHVAAVLYGVGNRLDEDASLFFTLRGIDVDDIVSQTVSDTAKTLLGKAEHQSDRILQDVDLGDVFGIQLDDVDVALADLPQVASSAPTKTKTTRQSPPPRTTKARAKTSKTTAAPQNRPARQREPITAPATSTRATKKTIRSNGPVPLTNTPPKGTMLESLVKAVGKARRGKSVDQLQDKLGWTKTQVRNTLARASAQGWIETVKPGFYRQNV
jgi:uncharacterized Zn finger protein